MSVGLKMQVEATTYMSSLFFEESCIEELLLTSIVAFLILIYVGRLGLRGFWKFSTYILLVQLISPNGF